MCVTLGKVVGWLGWFGCVNVPSLLRSLCIWLCLWLTRVPGLAQLSQQSLLPPCRRRREWLCVFLLMPRNDRSPCQQIESWLQRKEKRNLSSKLPCHKKMAPLQDLVDHHKGTLTRNLFTTLRVSQRLIPYDPCIPLSLSRRVIILAPSFVCYRACCTGLFFACCISCTELASNLSRPFFNTYYTYLSYYWNAL